MVDNTQRPREGDLRIWQDAHWSDDSLKYIPVDSVRSAKIIVNAFMSTVADESSGNVCNDSNAREKIGLEIYSHSGFDEPYEWCEWYDIEGRDIHEIDANSLNQHDDELDEFDEGDSGSDSLTIAILAVLFAIAALSIHVTVGWIQSANDIERRSVEYIQRGE
jgi:hypothetical protein